GGASGTAGTSGGVSDGGSSGSNAKEDASNGPGALGALLATMSPGTWAAAKATGGDATKATLSSVVYNGPLASAIFANTGPNAIMAAWSGAALDTVSESLLVWGGGHGDYGGNEVYAFSFDTLTWSRKSDPSSVAGYAGEGIYADGAPASRHTY